MKLGWLHVMQPMQGKTEGYVVLAWHRKAWWSWGLWWSPVGTKKIWSFKFFRRSAYLMVGKFGYFHFQHQ